MYLTEEERLMLDGRDGQAVSEAMKIQVALGEAMDAEKMVEVTRTHVAFAALESDIWFVRDYLKGARCRVSPTNNPLYDAEYLASLGQTLPEEDGRMLYAARAAFREIGITLTYSCTPYLQANVPRFGEIVAFSESSATPFVNSVLGARSNRESANSALAAAITGRVPQYGLLLDENRKGDILVQVEAEVRDDFDYHLLGYAAAKKMGYGIPVFTGIPATVTPEQLTSFGAQLNTGGAVAMYHITGVTPEAPDLKTAFGGKMPRKTVNVTNDDLRHIHRLISCPDDKIDFAIFGCPHYTITQIQNVARLLEGKTIHKNIELWICTSSLTKEIARRMGLEAIINRAGGYIIADTCPDMDCWSRRYGGKKGITDSPKAAYYCPRRGIEFVVKRMPDCIEAALKGGC